MKRLWMLTAMMAGAMLWFGCKDDEPVEPVTGYVENTQLYSMYLENNFFGDPSVRNVQVYLPTGYNLGERYPVLYFLPGIPMEEDVLTSKTRWDDFTNRYVGAVFRESADFPAEGFTTWMNELMDNGQIGKMIIVIPNAVSKHQWSFYTNSAANGNYENYIAYDLVKFIDDHYRTIRNPEGRIIMGHCQGGYGAFKIAMKHPGVFGQVGGLTPVFMSMKPIGMMQVVPYIYQENPTGLTGPSPGKFFTNWLYAAAAAFSPNLNNPPFYVDLPFDYETGAVRAEIVNKWENQMLYTLMEQYGNNLTAMEGIYFDCGDQDELGAKTYNVSFHNDLDAAGVDHYFEVYNGRHVNKLFERLETALVYFSGHLPVVQD